MKEKYYMCPNCGDLTTELKRTEKIEDRGNPGMCMCKYSDYDRQLVPYEEISYEEYVAEKI